MHAPLCPSFALCNASTEKQRWSLAPTFAVVIPPNLSPEFGSKATFAVNFVYNCTIFSLRRFFDSKEKKKKSESAKSDSDVWGLGSAAHNLTILTIGAYLCPRQSPTRVRLGPTVCALVPRRTEEQTLARGVKDKGQGCV